MGGSGFFEPKVISKNQSRQEQNGFPWGEMGFTSLEVFKQVSSND